jgi:integrase/recombinase XerD
MTPLGSHLTAFLRKYLPNQREMSVQTSDTYAYAFQLLVCFAAERLKVTPSELSVEQLDATLVLAFLEHLEKARENCARTRNSRLAAIKTFFKFLEYRLPTCLEQARRVRAIPVKKTDEVIVGYLNREEIQALLDAPDPSRRDGLRDRAMLHLAYAGGLRVSELVGLNLTDLTLHAQPSIHVMGKGRRERILPLWKETASTIRDWLKVRGEPKSMALFHNARGELMTRSGFKYNPGETRQNSQRKAAFAGQKTRFSPHFEARLRDAHLARHWRYSKGCPVVGACKPSEH